MEDSLKCQKCGGSQTRIRIKSGDRICYQCGYVDEIKKEVKDGS